MVTGKLEIYSSEMGKNAPTSTMDVEPCAFRKGRKKALLEWHIWKGRPREPPTLFRGERFRYIIIKGRWRNLEGRTFRMSTYGKRAPRERLRFLEGPLFRYLIKGRGRSLEGDPFRLTTYGKGAIGSAHFSYVCRYFQYWILRPSKGGVI